MAHSRVIVVADHVSDLSFDATVYGRCGPATKSRKMVVLGWENVKIYIFEGADYESDIFEFA